MSKEKEIKATGADNVSEETPDTETNVEEEMREAAPEIENEEKNEKEPVPAVEEELSEEEKLSRRVTELEDRLLRTMADFDNYKKRTARQFDEIIRAANARVLGEFLEIVDNFERALQHGDESTDFQAFRKGVELILGQMRDLLVRYDIKPIEAVGQPFDPNRHEALMKVVSDEYDEGLVAMEISKGYMQGDRVIRYSKVAVSSGAEKEK
ncbi:MAG: nucleotide exchange factor GrpE [Candidatus Zixiibacteriota bacterium]